LFGILALVAALVSVVTTPADAHTAAISRHLMLPAPRSGAARPAGRGPGFPGDLAFNGGQVQSAPRVYIDFWDWTSDPSGEQTYLMRFLTPWVVRRGWAR